MRAMDMAPTIAVKMTKKFRSRSAAVAPGMNSTQSFHQAGNSFSDTKFSPSDLRRQSRNRAVSLRTNTVLAREIPPTICFRLPSRGTFCREERILALHSENP